MRAHATVLQIALLVALPALPVQAQHRDTDAPPAAEAAADTATPKPAAHRSLMGEVMAGLIDKDAELARLAKQIAKLESDLKKTSARIANPSFGKAPEAVQQQARDLNARQQADIAALKEQEARIRAL